jgi:DNA-binding transcriptional LysR family regulator
MEARRRMMDLDLLRSFVSVVDAGGFTRAGERVHRTQSTVSQQMRRLEETLGRPLLHRNGKRATPTEEGERLLSYARRILALADEARDAVARPTGGGIVRLGIPEDFAAHSLTEMLSEFARSRPGLRLDVRCDLSVILRRDIERGELDVALFKRDQGDTGAVWCWPERLRWVTSRRHPVDISRDPLPLAVFPQGCLYRNRAIHALEAAGRAWHIAYTSPNFSSIQAAVSVGLGISILPDTANVAEHRALGSKHGLPPIDNTELALLTTSNAGSAARGVADLLANFCAASYGRPASLKRAKAGPMSRQASQAEDART